LDKGIINFLALGDSYTIGEGVDIDKRWPVQLITALMQRGLSISQPLVVARTGWTVGELLAGLREAAPGGVFDLVSVQAGVNDQYRGYEVGSYRRQFRTLLAEAIALAGGAAGKVMVLSIPDWGVTPYAQGHDRQKIADEIETFNLVNMAEAVGAGVHYVDVTPASRRAAQDASLLASDGLHPSAKMYATWVDLVLPVASRIIAAVQPGDAGK